MVTVKHSVQFAGRYTTGNLLSERKIKKRRITSTERLFAIGAPNRSADMVHFAAFERPKRASLLPLDNGHACD